MDTVQVEMVLLNYQKSHIPLCCKQLELTIYGVSWGGGVQVFPRIKTMVFFYKFKGKKDDKIMRHKI